MWRGDESGGLIGFFTKSELAGGKTPFTEVGDDTHTVTRLRGWYVMGIPRSFQVGSSKGTDHASPFSYDTHVPLAFYGLGISTGDLQDTYRTG